MGALIGWFCHYTPVEIITALGFIPYRLLGREGNTPRADTYLVGNLCPYVKSCLETAIRQELPALAGTVIARSCNAMIHLASTWPRYGGQGVTLVLDVPRRLDEEAVLYYSQNLRRLAKELARLGERQLEDSLLWQAINAWEEQRSCWREFLAARARGEICLSGSDVMAWLDRWQTCATAAGRDKGQAGIAAIEQRSRPDFRGRPRLMLAGSILPAELPAMVEEWGGWSVFEDACNGRRFLLAEVARETGDPYLHLAQLYLGGPPCPRMVADQTRRQQYWAGVVDDYQIDGVIYHVMKFCDAAIYDFRAMKDFCDRRGLPLLRLDGDYTGGGRGQWQTRVEAFLEMF
ncbi:2-hydroxyglutaryl-CoA dehydratase, D-component [Moorella glycerini]|uniref:R-phenyllactate dehydratase beta subunit n=1 Tax=Neomoorella stamsii TaxID=1266720 RepID=A0A9X7J3N3_9FIRM|nr:MULTISPECIES: 2-hydroxyacyl-CoA dehydratase family protein [Moorella]PRR72390.1 R-phenyllactate dehydratase beta subunit [Moorella stamsii]CEP67399.1 2-hydroxyglutaryl-CoA dehydratase, D-component [Moorella glycerini]